MGPCVYNTIKVPGGIICLVEVFRENEQYAEGKWNVKSGIRLWPNRPQKTEYYYRVILLI